MMELPGARGRVNPLEGFKLLGALISTKLMSEGPVRSPFWFPFPLATAEVEADRLMGREELALTAAGGLEVGMEFEAEGGEMVLEEEDLEMVLVDLDDLTVLDRVTGAEAGDGEGEGLVESLDEEGFDERDPEAVTSLAEAFLLSFDE